jgi:ABC-type multidrug transport system ATPase subunit
VDRDFIIGSSESCDIVIDGVKALQPRHAKLSLDLQGACIESLDGAPVTVNGSRIAQRTLLHDGDWLTLGETTFQLAILGGADRPTDAALPATTGGVMTFGRNPACEIYIDSPLVSRDHARLTIGPQGATLEDLGSTNGTFINGKRVKGRQALVPDDHIEIATFAFAFTGDSVSPLGADQHGRVQMDVLGLSKQVMDRTTKKPKFLLQDIEFSIQAGEFVAIFGTSGSGKSTLLDALSGRRPTGDGQVLYNGADLYAEFDRFRSAIGYVPQQDIVHRKIKVSTALGYTARLRLPPDTENDEIGENVTRVLDQVGLREKADLAVDTPEPLSGGQLKRVSLAVELVANPNILFLDEVTSGLDAGTDKKMMQLFGELARNYHKTVICVTHTLENIDVCNHIVLLHQGRLVYFGPPAEAAAYFGISRLSEVYELLESRPAKEWAAHYQASTIRQRYIGERLNKHRQAREAVPPQTESNNDKPSLWCSLRQTRTLMARNLSLIAADKRNLAILFLQAPLIGLVIGLVFNTNTDNDIARVASYNNMSFIMMLSAIWFGCLNSAREVVKELPIYLRERSINLGIGPYLASKLIPLAILALIQCVLLLAVVTGLSDLPGSFAERLGTLFLATLAATAMGLTISTLASSNDKAIAMVPILLIPQVILSGAVVKLENTPELIAKFTIIAYWAFDAMKLSFDDATLALKNPLGAPLMAVKHEFWNDLGALGLLTVAFLITAIIGLKLKDRKN